MINGGTSASYWLKEHLWTISAEQQFYIVFAVLFISFELSGFRRALFVLAATGCIVRLAFAAIYFNQFDTGADRSFAVYANSLCHFDAFSMGALVALSRDYIARNERLCIGLFMAGAFAAACYALSYFAINYYLLGRRGLDILRGVFSGVLYGQYREIFVYSVLDVCFASLICLIVAKNSTICCFTDHAVFRHIGKCSYGAYVYHVAIVAAALSFVGDVNPVYKRIELFVVAYVATVVVSYISYHGFEKKITAYAGRKISANRQATAAL